jgi:arylsulfatase A-like enzyme
VRIPLLLINKKIFQRELRVSTLGRQIDIAPTILAELGYSEPTTWQGCDLLADTAVERAYLFSSNGDFLFGLVDGNFKYIYNPDSSTPEIYDLASDSAEAHDLASDPLKSFVIQRDKSRVAAWITFQNRYLHQFEHK